jgi:HAD superfamily hydrolase (TIGR01662 family)
MIKAVLLDLDDTLIRNPNQGFVPGYLHLIDHYFEDRFGVKVSKGLVQGVRSLSSLRDMRQLNLSLILSHLSEMTTLDEAQLRGAFHNFYVDHYPELRACTQPVDCAPALVSALLERGYQVAIATNPLYPEAAIHQRLEWAGIATADIERFSFITTADNMHFAKPDPAYYAELIARVGVEPDEALMVGDSDVNDIQAAARVGLRTVKVTPDKLEAFYTSIDHLEDIQPPTADHTMIDPQLRGNVGALFGLLETLKQHYWDQHPIPGEWSPLEILCHLVEREKDVHLARLQRIASEDNPFIIDPGPGHPIRCAEDGTQAPADFLALRRNTLRFLNGLPEHAWNRPARHSIFGPTTLFEMALFTAQHDRLHLRQLCRTIGKCK